MASFFKKLFGIKETESKPLEHSLPTIKISAQLNIVQMEQPAIAVINKNYDIAEIKKQSTEIKNKEGFLSSINFLKDFIETNKIEFTELFSLLKKVIPYMKKEKTIQDIDIINYINIHIEQFKEKNLVENQINIAELLSQVDNIYGLEYLEKKLLELEKSEKLTLANFDSVILLSDFYLKDKQSDKAFQTLRRATNLVTNFNNKFDYLWKQRIIAEKSAKICLYGQKLPQNADYIYFHILAFLLDVFDSSSVLGWYGDFFDTKNTCLKDGWWGFEENENFDKALMDLRITEHKKELLLEIYNYKFNELPLLAGFPKEYFNEKIHKSIFDCLKNDESFYANPKWIKYTEVLDIFSSRPFNEIGIINAFVSAIVKKYCDKGNNQANIVSN